MTRLLRIAHVLPLIAVDGAFGGPVAVAMAQSTEQARRRHAVQILAGSDGHVRLDLAGVVARTFAVVRLPGFGLSGLLSPGLSRELRRAGKGLDVVHIHVGRHIGTLMIADMCRRRRIPYVLQTHGMLTEDGRPKGVILDALLTRRVLEGARAVLALTQAEEESLLAVSRGKARIVRIRNGIAPAPASHTEIARDAREVVFLARLHPRKRVLDFARMATALESSGIDATFTVIGPDEGDLPALLEHIQSSGSRVLRYLGTIEPGQAEARLARAGVYVLPSVGEVFPMTVLEAMAVGTPTVITRDSGISSELSEQRAALVTDGSVQGMAEAVRTLLTEPSFYEELQQRMADTLRTHFGIHAVVDILLTVYEPPASAPTPTQEEDLR